MADLPVSQALREAARHVEEAGWAQNSLFEVDPTRLTTEQLDTASCCAYGAVGWAAGKYTVSDHGGLDIATKRDRLWTAAVAEDAYAACNTYLRQFRDYNDDLINWNDEVATSSADVIELLAQVADWYDAARTEPVTGG